MKLSDLGKKVFENDRVALVVNDEKPGKLSVYVLPKVGDKIHAPLGFVLGSNALDYEYKLTKT